MKYFLCVILFLTISTNASAQETDAPVKSINGIIDELLDQITPGW